MQDERCELLSIDLPRAELVRQRLQQHNAAEGALQAKALADPTRLTLALALLEGGELCVCDLAWISGRAENLVGHHLRALRTAGLASSRRDGKLVLYALSPVGRRLVEVVTGVPSVA